ncbi:MAG: hypothetical protein H6Q31_2102 [Bacteroidetes bacterium]|nr:hypothetical protein [Bacteroidota bacterium]
MKFNLVSCEVLYREICHLIARSPHQVDLRFLPKGLHDIGASGMVERLQAAVDAADMPGYDAILMGYALCNNGIAGLRARTLPLVIPRGHDCMTLFFGGRDQYMRYFQDNPGTYFLTSGWIERGEPTGELRQLSIQNKAGMDLTYEQLVEKYGEENARFLFDELCDITKHYSQITYIAMGVEPGDQFERTAEERAREHGWKFDRVKGNMTLLERLVCGQWDDADFLVVPPGHKVVPTYDDRIIAAEPETV